MTSLVRLDRLSFQCLRIYQRPQFVELLLPAATWEGLLLSLIGKEGGGGSTFNLSFPHCNPQDYRKSIYFCKLNVAEINRQHYVNTVSELAALTTALVSFPGST